MSIGESGRIVIEVPPATKRELYAALARDGLTLKGWFLTQAHEYVLVGAQTRLPFHPIDQIELENVDKKIV